MRSHTSSSSLEAFGCISMSISGACPSPCGLKLLKLALNELKAPTDTSCSAFCVSICTLVPVKQVI